MFNSLPETPERRMAITANAIVNVRQHDTLEKVRQNFGHRPIKHTEIYALSKAGQPSNRPLSTEPTKTP
jgi:hypothetical protein